MIDYEQERVEGAEVVSAPVPNLGDLDSRNQLEKVDALSTSSLLSSSAEPSSGGESLELVFAMAEILDFLRETRINSGMLHAVLCLRAKESGTIRLKDLAAMIGVTNANMTSVADNLEALDLAKRAYHGHDRRQTLVQLTDRGRLLVSWILARISGRNDVERPSFGRRGPRGPRPAVEAGQQTTGSRSQA